MTTVHAIVGQAPAILAHLAGTAVGAFVVAVLIDIALGVAIAIKTHTFDMHRLPSFLESQMGTKAALAVGGLVVMAAIAPQKDLKTAILVALSAGAAAQTAAVAADVRSKVVALFF